MQQLNHNLIRCFSQVFDFKGKKVLEIGSFVIFGQDKIMDLRQYFKDSHYIGCDILEGEGVDIVENAENLTFPDEYFDLVICLDTLEHIKNPHIAVNEMHRVLKEDGILILSSVMDCGIHNFPNDYFRFTPESFREMTSCFKTQFIGYYGIKEMPQNIYAICFKEYYFDKAEQFYIFYNKFKEYSKGVILVDNLLSRLAVFRQLCSRERKVIKMELVNYEL